jgi:hypothetical protein
MKWLKRFNESNNYDDIIKNIKDILLELSDNEINVNVYNIGSCYIILKIGDEYGKFIELQRYEMELVNLIDYMSGEKFEISGKSYVLNERWKSENLKCYDCGRNKYNIREVDFKYGEKYYECVYCRKKQSEYFFIDKNHYINNDLFLSLINKNKKVRYIEIIYQ